MLLLKSPVFHEKWFLEKMLKKSIGKYIRNIEIFRLYKCIKGPLSSLRQFMITESPSKLMKSVFLFVLKPLFVFEIFLSWFFGYIEKQLDNRAKLSFKISQMKLNNMITNKLITQIGQYRKKSRKFGKLIKYSVKAIFCQKSCSNRVVETSCRPLFVLSKNPV